MDILLALDKLKGSMPPLITPFKDGEVDYDTYASLVKFQIERGSHGILVNGTTSEPSTLTIEERNKVVDVAVEINQGQVPIVVASGSQSLSETKILTNYLKLILTSLWLFETLIDAEWKIGTYVIQV